MASLFDPPFILIYSSQMASGLLTMRRRPKVKSPSVRVWLGEAVSPKGVLQATRVFECVAALRDARRRDRQDRSARPPAHRDWLMPAILKTIFLARSAVSGSRLVDLGRRSAGGPVAWVPPRLFRSYSRAPELYAHRSGVMIMMCASAALRRRNTLYVIAQDYVTHSPAIYRPSKGVPSRRGSSDQDSTP